MFGHHRRAREKQKFKNEKQAFNQQKKDFEANSPQREKESADFRNSQVNERTQQAKKERQEAYQEGRNRSNELFSRDVQGLDPAKRQAMQYEANKGIQRSMQSANRKLLGEQAQHGIVGKGGVGYAQQRDLQRLGTEAQAGVHRDLDKLNSDLALKKLAAMFNVEQGEASQAQLDRQLAVDELHVNDEKKRQRQYEDQFNRLFSRV
jgi:hypothetical protein